MSFVNPKIIKGINVKMFRNMTKVQEKFGVYVFVKYIF